MAFVARKSMARPVPFRRGPSPRLKKMEARIASGARRAALAARDQRRELTAIGAAGLYGLARGKAWDMPTIGGLNPALLYGVVGYLAPSIGVKGKVGETLRSAGTGLLCVAAEKIARTGSPTGVGFDDDSEELEAD